MQIGFTYAEAESMPFGVLLDYITIDNINKYDFVEVMDEEQEFDLLMSYK